jgi:hypothetical protein
VEWDGTNLTVVSTTVSVNSSGIQVNVLDTSGFTPASANAYKFTGASGADLGMYATDDVANPLGSQILWLKSGGAGAHRPSVRLTNGTNSIYVGVVSGWTEGIQIIGPSGILLVGNVEVGSIKWGVTASAIGGTSSSPIFANSLDVTAPWTSGTASAYKIAAWDAIGWNGSATLVLGGYMASQWTRLAFYASGTHGFDLDSNGDIVPPSDNTRHVGVPTARFAYMTALAFNTTDVGLENGWSLTESYRIGVDEPGVGLVDDEGNLIAFFGKKRAYLRNVGDVDDLPHHVTTFDQRIHMDPTPEIRIKGHDSDGKPIFKTKADVPPMPDPKTARSERQRAQLGR